MIRNFFLHQHLYFFFCIKRGIKYSFLQYQSLKYWSYASQLSVCSPWLTTMDMNVNTHLAWHTTAAVWRCQPAGFHWEAHKTGWTHHRWHTVRGYTLSSSTRFSGRKQKTGQSDVFILHVTHLNHKTGKLCNIEVAYGNMIHRGTWWPASSDLWPLSAARGVSCCRRCGRRFWRGHATSASQKCARNSSWSRTWPWDLCQETNSPCFSPPTAKHCGNMSTTMQRLLKCKYKSA